MASNVVGAATVEVRGTIDPLKNDFREARAEAAKFSKAAGGDATKSVAQLRRETKQLERETRAYNRAADQAEREMRKFTQTTNQANASLGVQDSLMQAARRSALQLGAAVGAAFAIHNFIDFEDALAEVSTLVDTSVVSMDDLRDSALNASAAFGGDASQQAKALYQIISAGAQDAATANDILTASNKLAVGGVTDVATAADGLTSVLNAYGDQVGGTTDVSDAMFTAMKAGKTTIGELSNSLGVVAPIAAQTGVSFDELTAAAAALTKGGVTTNVAMTGLRAIISAVAKPSSEAVQLSKKLGLEFNATALQSKGLAGFLAEVTDKTKGNTSALAQLFGGVEALVPIMALTGNQAGDFADILELMSHKAGATKEAFDKMAQSPGFAAGLLWGSLQKEALKFADSLTQAVVPALQFLSTNMGVILDAITILAATAIPALVVAMKVALVNAIKAVAIAFIANPFGFLAAAIAGVIAQAYVFRHEIARTSANILRAFEYLVNGAIGYLNKLIRGLNVVSGALGQGKLSEIGNVDLSGTIKSLDDFAAKGEKAAVATGKLNVETKKAVPTEGDFNTNLLNTNQTMSDAEKAAKRLADQRKDTIDGLKNEIAMLDQLVPLAKALGTTEDDLADARDRISTAQKLQLPQNSKEAKQIDDLIAKRRALNQELKVAKAESDLRSQVDLLGQIAPLYDDQSKSMAEINKEVARLTLFHDLGIKAGSKEAQTLGDLLDKQEKLNEAEKKRALKDDAESRIASLNDEIAVLGMTTERATAYRVEQELINKANEDGITITPELADQIRQYAEKIGETTGQLERMEKQLQATKDAEDFFRSGFADALDDLIFKGDSLSDVFANLAVQIGQAALKGALLGEGPLGSIFGGSNGGGLLGSIFGGGSTSQGTGGGLLSSLFTSALHLHNGTSSVGAGNPKRSAPVSMFVNAPRLHDGLKPGEFPAILQAGEGVTPRNGRQQGGGGVTVVQNVYPKDYDSFRRTQRQEARRVKEVYR